VRAQRVQGALTLLTLVLALIVAVARGGEPLRMNDYGGFGDMQSVWPLGQQRLFVVSVPAFNQPVRLRAVELRTVYSIGDFDRPAAYLLQFHDQDHYGGVQLTTEAGLDAFTTTALHPPRHAPLDALPVQKLDNHLNIVIPINIHQPGCHEAQIVLRVATSDGSVHTLATRWFVGVDTGISRSGSGNDMCAGPRD
jgi:hypothetical protein